MPSIFQPSSVNQAHTSSHTRVCSAGSRTISMEPDGRFSLPAEFAGALEATDGVMLVGKGDKFQLWNPGQWQARREADRAKMAAIVRGMANSDSNGADA